MTVIQMRELLRAIDVDSDKRMSIIEFLIHRSVCFTSTHVNRNRYKKSVAQIIAAPQGDNKEQIEEAQSKVEEAQKAVEEMVKRLEEQKDAANRAKDAANEARSTEEVVSIGSNKLIMSSGCHCSC